MLNALSSITSEEKEALLAPVELYNHLYNEARTHLVTAVQNAPSTRVKSDTLDTLSGFDAKFGTVSSNITEIVRFVNLDLTSFYPEPVPGDAE